MLEPLSPPGSGQEEYAESLQSGRLRLRGMPMPAGLVAELEAVARILPSEFVGTTLESIAEMLRNRLLRSVAHAIICPHGVFDGLRILAIETGGDVNHHAYVADGKGRLFHLQPVFAGNGPVLKLARIHEWVEGCKSTTLVGSGRIPRGEERNLCNGIVPGNHRDWRLAQWVAWSEQFAVMEAWKLGATTERTLAIREFNSQCWARVISPLLDVADQVEGEAVLKVMDGFKTRAKRASAPLPGADGVSRDRNQLMLVQRNRVQALHAFPILQAVFKKDGAEMWRPRHELGRRSAIQIINDKQCGGLKPLQWRSISGAVDRGDSLTHALEGAVGLKPWMLKRLRHCPAAQLGDYWSHIPELVEDWALVGSAAVSQIGPTVLYEQFRRPWTGKPLFMEAFRTSRKHGHLRGLAQCMPGMREGEALRDYFRFLSALSRWITARSEACDENELHTYLGEPTIEDLHRLSNRWHAAEVRVARLMGPKPAAIRTANRKAFCWPALVPETVSCEGFEFVELVNQADLDDESFVMSHCVRSYGHRCLAEECHIFRVSESGKPAVTLRIDRSLDGVDQFAIRESSARHNHRPDARADAAVKKFVDGINSGDISSVKVPVKGSKERKAIVQEIIDNFGEDPGRLHAGEGPLVLFRTALGEMGQPAVLAYRPGLELSNDQGCLFAMVERAAAAGLQ